MPSNSLFYPISSSSSPNTLQVIGTSPYSGSQTNTVPPSYIFQATPQAIFPPEVNREAFDAQQWNSIVDAFRDRGIEPFDVEVAMILVYVRKFNRTIDQEIDDFFPFILQRRVLGGR